MSHLSSEPTETTMERRTDAPLLRLPDELIIEIICELDLRDVLALSQVSRRLHALAHVDMVWIRLFEATGHRIKPSLWSRIVGTPVCPGSWDGRDWTPGRSAPASQSSWSVLDLPARIRNYVESFFRPQPDRSEVSASEQETPVAGDRIAVHFPTLVRSAIYIKEEMRLEGPHRGNDPRYPDRWVGTGEEAANRAEYEDGDLVEVGAGEGEFVPDDRMAVHPRFLYLSREHSAKVYVTRVHGHWLVSGSRDRSFKIWRLPSLPIDGSPVMYTPDVVYTCEAAHEGSILYLEFEDYGDGTGVVVTGSSDGTAKVWDVEWGHGDDAKWEGTRVKLVTTITRHAKAVAGVDLTSKYLVTCSHDGHLLLYDRTSLSNSPELIHDLNLAPLGEGYPTGLTIVHDTVFVAGFKNALPSVNLATGAVSAISADTDGKITAVDATTDWIACGNDNGNYLVIPRARGEVMTLLPSLNTRLPTRAVRLAPGINLALFATLEGEIAATTIETSPGGEYRFDGPYRSYRFGGPFSLDRDGVYLVAAVDTKVAIVVYGTGKPYAGLLE